MRGVATATAPSVRSRCCREAGGPLRKTTFLFCVFFGQMSGRQPVCRIDADMDAADRGGGRAGCVLGHQPCTLTNKANMQQTRVFVVAAILWV